MPRPRAHAPNKRGGKPAGQDTSGYRVASFSLAHHRDLSVFVMINDLFPGMKPMITAQS